MKLIDNCKGAWKHYSTQALFVAANLQGAWALLDAEVKADLPPSVGHAVAWITFIVVLYGLAGKFVDQTPKDKP